jgi:hypothetical protein
MKKTKTDTIWYFRKRKKTKLHLKPLPFSSPRSAQPVHSDARPTRAPLSPFPLSPGSLPILLCPAQLTGPANSRNGTPPPPAMALRWPVGDSLTGGETPARQTPPPWPTRPHELTQAPHMAADTSENPPTSAMAARWWWRTTSWRDQLVKTELRVQWASVAHLEHNWAIGRRGEAAKMAGHRKADTTMSSGHRGGRRQLPDGTDGAGDCKTAQELW